MGQYYRPTIMKNDYKVETTLVSYDYDNGSKLMEHSWIGNNFVSAAAVFLSNGPRRLAWIGDYAELDDFEELQRKGKPITQEQFETVIKKVWGPESRDAGPKHINPIVNMRIGFLINHSTKEFINLANYVERVKDWQWKVNPLSLLTAVGNGKGGGDYRDDIYSDAVGDWAFDLIEYKETITDGELNDFEELEVFFAEGPRDAKNAEEVA